MIIASDHLIIDKFELIGGFESVQGLFSYDFMIVLPGNYCLGRD